MKGYRNFTIFIVMILTLIILYYLFKDKIKMLFKKYVPDVTKNKNTGDNSKVNDNIVLSKGDNGESVKILQGILNVFISLNNTDLKTLTIDGDFGSKTEDTLYKITGQKSISIKDLNLFMNNPLNNPEENKPSVDQDTLNKFNDAYAQWEDELLAYH